MPEGKPNEESRSRPYVNGLQEWLGESHAAGRFIAVWMVASLSLIAGSALMGNVPLGVVGALSFLLTTNLQFWRREIAPELRHSREVEGGESDA